MFEKEAEDNKPPYAFCALDTKCELWKDGELPKIGKPCLVYLVNSCVIIARLREDNVWTTDGHNAFENVIAWKEIVLPEPAGGKA